MLISPDELIDPFDAVGDFLKGELRFHLVSEEAFRETPIVVSQSITRTSQALRFARMHQEMPDLSVSPQTWRSISVFLGEDRLGGTVLPKEIRRDHRLFRELKKIFLNAGGDFVRAAQTLREAGLLSLLARAGFYFPFDPNSYDSNGLNRTLGSRGWTPKERKDALRLVRNRRRIGPAWIRALFCRYLMTRDAPWNPVKKAGRAGAVAAGRP
jgi:hypothetical protein